MLVDMLLKADRDSAKMLAVHDPTRSLTYRRLTLLSAALRRIVQRSTNCPRVGILLPASAAFPAALFGVLWTGRVAVPLNFLLGADVLARVVQNAEIDLIISTRHFCDLLRSLPARSLFLEELPLRRSLLIAMARRYPPAPPVDPDDTAVMLYTSGTTSDPKGVELTFRNLHSNCFDAIDTLRIDPKQRLLNVLPPFHVFGLTANVLVPIALQATVHAIPRFSPVATVKAVRAERITIMMAIPSMYAAILKTKSARADSFRSVFLAISGGESLPERTRLGFQERFGVILRQGYGLTETSPVLSVCGANGESYREGSVGKPIRNVEVCIAGSAGSSRSSRSLGEPDEILVRGPGIMKGYYKNPAETRRVIDADGWFHTGDIGRLDQDGFLYVTGRAKEMLIIGGENVAPCEIEAALEQHAGVAQVAVIGAPDSSRGEVPVAFVIPEPGAVLAEQELRQFAKQMLPGFKVPRRVFIRDDLPKGPTGKILKRRLHDLL